MPIGDRIRPRHPGRRLVRSGEPFSSDELERGDIELELPDPAPEQPPDDEQAEPWSWHDKVPGDRMRRVLDTYGQFLESRRGSEGYDGHEQEGDDDGHAE
jgi:hypothetical protein